MGQTRKEWLQTVTAQLRCRRAVPGVERELENHLSEQYNAFVAQGCAPEEAERRTVESMGDPVLAGGALDRVHRPRPAWGPFFMVAALLLAGALLRFFWSVPVSAQGVYLWREGAYQSLAAALAGIAVLAAVYFCMDVSLLARWTKALYIGLAAVSAYGFLAGYTLMNGRRLWTVWGVSYDATHFSMIFIPIYAAVVYRQRGRGWAGLLVSGFAIVPGLWLCIMVPHLAAACVLGLAGLAVCLVCCAGDWYGLGGKKSFAVVLGVTAGSLVVTFLLVLLLMPGLAGSLQRHLEVLLAPDANAAGAGYWMNALRRMWDGMRWLGPGDGSLPLGEKAALGTVGEFAGKAVRELRADYLLAYAGWRYGIACAAALAAAVAGALLQDRTISRKLFSNLPAITPGWILLTVLIVVAIGALIGMVNGFFVAKFSLHPFIVTLATQLITYGLILIFFMLNGNNGQPVSGLSQEYKSVVSAPMIQFTTGSGAKISIPWYVLYAVIFVALMWFIWNKTAFGKNMFAVGSNADAAKVSGVNVFWTTVMVHTLAGAMYGVTGFIEGARISSITQSAGLNYECDAIAACVIGGVSFVGGTGKISGIVLGVFVLRIIFVALSMLGIDPSMQYIIKGGIILAACSLDMRKYLAKK